MRRRPVCVWIPIAIAVAACDNSQGDLFASIRNSPPVADAGPDQTHDVFVGDVVVLDGSGSSDADADPLTYVWELSTPAHSAATVSEPDTDQPTFVADEAGSYTARLVVDDGMAVSPPDHATVVVVVPAPIVSIAEPEPDTIVNESPIPVSGAVDDPLAVISVNDVETANDDGSYSTEVPLAEGSNTITVVATNDTGQGSAQVEVTLRTQRGPGPAMTIMSPKPDFTAGIVWGGGGEAPRDVIPLEVRGTVTTEHGPPTVSVNGESAVVSALARGPLLELFCSLLPPFLPTPPACDPSYGFVADLLLSKGPQTISATGFDTLGESTTATVSGAADYCRIGEADPSVDAERGRFQNNRCHEIDGCNRNQFGAVGSHDTVSLRNQPMPNAIDNLVAVEFGSGYIPAIDDRNDFFVHGQQPRDLLGCNLHDTCYQTCEAADSTPAELLQAFTACNLRQYEDHKAMCRRAYPATCPFTGLEVLRCPNWLREKTTCFTIASIYLSGVELGGASQYDVRQADFCAAQ